MATVMASRPCGMEIDCVLTVSSDALIACPFCTGALSTWSDRPWSDVRSEGEYDLDGSVARPTRPCASIACPVVPAGMFALATTAEKLCGDPEPGTLEFFFAPCTLA